MSINAGFDQGNPTPVPPGQGQEQELSPEDREHQENHEAAVRALNKIGVPQEFTDLIRWFEAKHSKAYKGIKTYGLNYQDTQGPTAEETQLIEQQGRAHEMMHLYWASLTNPKVTVPIPPDIDFGKAAQEHQETLPFWTLMQTLPKALLTLSDYQFHHHMPGSAEKARQAMNANPTGFLDTLRKSCQQSKVPFEYGLAATLEYLEGINTNAFYENTGLGTSFEEGLMMYLSSVAVYGDDIAKWQVQEDQRANYYKIKFHEVFGGPDKLLAFIQEKGMDAFVEKVKVEIQSGNATSSEIPREQIRRSVVRVEDQPPVQNVQERMPKALFELVLYSVFVLMVEDRDFSVNSGTVTESYRSACQNFAAYLDGREKESGYRNSLLPEIGEIVRQISLDIGEVCLCTESLHIDLGFEHVHKEGEEEETLYFKELLKAFNVESLEDLLSSATTFLRDKSTKQCRNIVSPLANYGEISSSDEVVAVIDFNQGDSELSRKLTSVAAKLIIVINPQFNDVNYQVMVEPGTERKVSSQDFVEDQPQKKEKDKSRGDYSDREKISALVHVLSGNAGQDISILGPDDVPPSFTPNWNMPPSDSDEGQVRIPLLNIDVAQEVSLFDSVHGLSKSVAAAELFRIALKKQKLTDLDWALLKARLPFSTVDLLIELIQQRKELKAKQPIHTDEYEQTSVTEQQVEIVRVREF